MKTLNKLAADSLSIIFITILLSALTAIMGNSLILGKVEQPVLQKDL